METIIPALEKEFKKIFQQPAEEAYFAPGRVNLIGEHTDYNGGHVFPSAISQGTYALVRRTAEEKVRVHSMNFEADGVRSFGLEDLSYHKEDGWINYIRGMYQAVRNQTESRFSGIDILIYGNIPNGAGLSSSASLELLIGVMLNHQYELELPQVDLVKLGQWVENEYVGVNSGIMDQFAVGMGKADYAIFLDVNDLSYELVPVELGDYRILIMNTNKRRELADSKYNERRSECDEALARLQKVVDIKTLGDLSLEEFEKYQHHIEDERLIKRARHAVSENERTIIAKDYLTKGDLQEFGLLLNQSHESLRDDFDVTGIELDTLVELAWDQPEVIGARMTGAGMGGCAIALIHKEAIDEAKKTIGEAYEEKIGYAPSFYVAQIGDGAKHLVDELGK